MNNSDLNKKNILYMFFKHKMGQKYFFHSCNRLSAFYINNILIFLLAGVHVSFVPIITNKVVEYQ